MVIKNVQIKWCYKLVMFIVCFMYVFIMYHVDNRNYRQNECTNITDIIQLDSCSVIFRWIFSIYRTVVKTLTGHCLELVDRNVIPLQTDQLVSRLYGDRQFADALKQQHWWFSEQISYYLLPTHYNGIVQIKTQEEIWN